MGILGNRKKPNLRKQQIETANQLRDIDNRIIRQLRMLKIECHVPGAVSQTQLDNYEAVRKAMIEEFDGTPVRRINLIDMDLMLEKMVQKLQEAIYAGDRQTVAWVCNGLLYAREEGRKDINESEIEREPEIREARLKKLQKYALSAELSEKIRELREHMAELQHDIDVTANKRNRKNTELNKMLSENPLLEEKLGNAGNLAEQADPDVLHLSTLITEAYDLNENIKDSRTQLEKMNNQRAKYEADIRINQQALNAQTDVLDQEWMDIIRSMDEEIAHALVEGTQQSKEIQSEIEKIHKIYDNFLESWSDEMVRSSVKLQEMRRKEEEEAKGRALAAEMTENTSNNDMLTN